MRIFTVAGSVGFIVGFALFGVITYLPQYQQVVRGASATSSGLQLFPLMGGLLLASVGSGQIISRTGRYKIFPVVGTAILAIGMFLLSHLGVHTSVLKSALFMGVTGVGLGLTMQVLVLAVQNSVDARDLGTATSAVTFFRSIGGSIGVSVFSAIFNNRMTGNLHKQLPQLGGDATKAKELQASPAALAKLPPAIHDGYLRAFTDSLHVVFLAAIPIAAVAFGLTWLLKEVPLRSSVAPIDGVSASFGMLRAAAVQVQQEGQARVAAAKAALSHLSELRLSERETATLSEIFTARISYLEQIARETPEPDQAGPGGWALALDVLRTERQVLAQADSTGASARDELAVRLHAARAALARLDAADAAGTMPAIAPLRDAYVSRIERIQGMVDGGGAVVADNLTPSFWRASALLLTKERETLAAWHADDQVDSAVADRADRDLSAEEADLAISARTG